MKVKIFMKKEVLDGKRSSYGTKVLMEKEILMKQKFLWKRS